MRLLLIWDISANASMWALSESLYFLISEMPWRLGPRHSDCLSHMWSAARVGNTRSQCAKHPSVTTKEGPPSTLASEPSCPPGCLPLIKTFVCTCEAKWFAAVVTFWPYYPANLCRDFPRSPLRQMLSQNIAVTFHFHNAAVCTGTALTNGKNFNGCLDLIVLLVLCCHEPMRGRGEGFTLCNRTRVNESHTRMWGELGATDSEAGEEQEWVKNKVRKWLFALCALCCMQNV